MGFPGGSVLKNPPAKKVTWVRSLEGSHIGKIKGFPRREESLEKEMATHSSILAWEIPWTEEPGGLQSRDWKRVGHDLATKQQPCQLRRYHNVIMCVMRRKNNDLKTPIGK